MSSKKFLRFFFLWILSSQIYWTNYSLFAQDTTSVSGNLEVHFLNVGQADAIYIICPTKQHTMLIDAADTRYPGSADSFKIKIGKLTGADGKINVVVASHPHADHIGNMKWVLEHYDIVRYLDNGASYPSSLYEDLMDVVHEQDNSGSIKYESLEDADKNFVDFCPANNVDATLIRADDLLDNCENANNCSVVVRVDYGKTSLVFVGDAEQEEEQKLLADSKAKKMLNVDVLKAGHHGSNTSSSLAFIKAVSPKYVVVSCGKKGVGTNKKYKHPQLNSLNSFNAVLKTTKYRDEEVEVYDKAKKKWMKKKVKDGVYYTVIDGDVVITSDGNTIKKGD